MILTLDPSLKNNVEYTLWHWEGKWNCECGNVPFIGQILGEGDDPKAALADAIAKLDAAFDELNR